MFSQKCALHAFVAVLMLATIVHSALIPSHIIEADYYIYEHRVINATYSPIANLTINVSLPHDYEIISAPPSYKIKKDAWGNPYLYVFEQNASMPYSFALNLSVHSKSAPLRSLPNFAQDFAGSSLYLASTSRVPALDPQIRQLALNITQNASTPFERIALLAKWVHSYIHYDDSMVGILPDVTSILQQRRGVCTEYTLLFSTLARSLGYPTRFVGGYAYSPQQDAWQGHSWAEVWLGEWVAVDPTWLEVGSVDATHIVLTKGPIEQLSTILVSALLPSSGEITLEHKASAGLRADQVHPRRLEAVNLSLANFNYSSNRIPIGGQAIVWVEHNSSEYKILQASLYSCTLNSSSKPLFSAQRLYLDEIVEPNRTYYLIWPLKASSSLDPNYIYSCPISVRTDFSDIAFSINVSDEFAKDWPVIFANLHRSSLLPGEHQKVFVQLPPSLAGQEVYALERNMLLKKISPPLGNVVFDFVPSGLGTHTIYIFSSRGDPIALSYNVQSLPLPIINISAPSSPIIEGSRFNITLYVFGINSSSIILSWLFAGQGGQKEITASSNSEIISIPLSFAASSSGDFILSVRAGLADGTELVRQAFPLHVYPASNMSISSVSLQSYAQDGWRVVVEIQKEGDVIDPQLVMQSGSWPIPSDGKLHLIVPEGNYHVILRWQDVSGQLYQKEAVLNITPPMHHPISPPKGSEAYPYDVRAIPVLIFLALVFAGLMGAALYLRIRSLGEAESDYKLLEDAGIKVSYKKEDNKEANDDNSDFSK